MGSDRAQERGQRFIKFLIWLLLGAIATYVLLHVLIKDAGLCEDLNTSIGTLQTERLCVGSSGSGDWRYFVSIDPNGSPSLNHISEVDWYVGAETASEVLELLKQNFMEMERLREDLAGPFRALRSGLISEDPIDKIEELIDEGDYKQARNLFNKVFSSLPPEEQNELRAQISPRSINSSLMGLDRLKKKQLAEASTLTPPLNSFFFWTSPNLSMLEVMAWAFFGVITNLLVNSVEYLRKGDFKYEERWVAYTKLVYGPILSMILILAMVNGMFDAGSYEVRVWTLPLLGFIFGYASRRTAKLVDALLERLLGSVDQSIKAGPEAVRAKRKQRIEALKTVLHPKNIDELREQAKTIQREGSQLE